MVGCCLLLFFLAARCSMIVVWIYVVRCSLFVARFCCLSCARRVLYAGCSWLIVVCCVACIACFCSVLLAGFVCCLSCGVCCVVCMYLDYYVWFVVCSLLLGDCGLLFADG